MKDCLFCKIINGEIPCHKIFEDEFTFAFLDIADDFEGHTLIVPKQHFNSILDCNKETLNKVMETVQKISNHYVQNCGYDGVNVLNNSGECAHQSVHHLHMHVVPRKNNDNLNMYAKQEKKNSNFQKLAETLKIN